MTATFRPITSASDDRLLCTFGLDAFVRLRPHIRCVIWQHAAPAHDAIGRSADLAARLALVLILDESTFDPKILHHLAKATLADLLQYGRLTMHVEDADIDLSVSKEATLLMRLLCLTRLRGMARGRNRLGLPDPQLPLVDPSHRARFIHAAGRSANRLVAEADRGHQSRSPTISELAALARSYAVRHIGQSPASIASLSGQLRYNPVRR